MDAKDSAPTQPYEGQGSGWGGWWDALARGPAVLDAAEALRAPAVL